MEGFLERSTELKLSNAQPADLHVVQMLRFMSNINHPSLPAPFYSVLVSISVFMALSTALHSINSPDNSPLSHSVLPVLPLPYWLSGLKTPVN